MAQFEAKIHGMELKGTSAPLSTIPLKLEDEQAAERARMQAIERVKARRSRG